MEANKSQSPVRPDRKVLISFFVYILLMGGAPVAMRITFAELDPFFMGLLRFGLGAVIYWIFFFLKGHRIPKGRQLAGPVLYGILGIGISFALIVWGLVEVPASLAAIFLALIPMLTVIMASIQGLEPLTSRSILGALLSVTGTFIAVGASPSSNGISLIHVSALILGVVFMAQGGVTVKRYPANPPIVTNAIAMTVGAAILAFASLITGETWLIPSLPATWFAIGFLVVFVSFAGFLLYLHVLNNWTASGSSFGFVIIPFVTIFVSAFLTREQITVNLFLGLALVIAGVIYGALIPKKAVVTSECATC